MVSNSATISVRKTAQNTTMSKRIEIEQIISEGMTLRKFYNLVVRLLTKNGVGEFFDWDDFKRWNGQVHDVGNCELGNYKFITEWDEFNSCYIYFLDEPKA